MKDTKHIRQDFHSVAWVMPLPPEIVKIQIIYIPLQGMLLQVILMSFLTLEFAISFLKVLNIDFPLILISLNVVERSLLL